MTGGQLDLHTPGTLPLPHATDVAAAEQARTRIAEKPSGREYWQVRESAGNRERQSVNRRLSLRWFEPNTCHYLRKRPVACVSRSRVLVLWA